LTQPGNYT